MLIYELLSRFRRTLDFRFFGILFLIIALSVTQALGAGPKGPIGVSGNSSGAKGPVTGTSTTKLKSDIIVINAPVKKVTGAPGAKGLTGAQGAVGPSGPEGQEGMIGPQGPEGLQGIQGPQGIQGIQGPVGPQGATGSQGPKGDTGAQGPAGPPGPPGPAGSNGSDGSGGGGTGAQGPPGIQGPSGTISIGTVSYGDSPSITNVGTSSAAILNFVFPNPSSTGSSGIPGPIGPTGPPGPTGSPGSKGDKGDTGLSGTISIGTVTSGPSPLVTNVGTSSNAIFNFVLPEINTTGTKGDKGDKGDTGAQGPIGLTGPTGPPGPTGSPGADGAPGKDGAPGIQGPKGDSGIVNLVKATSSPSFDSSQSCSNGDAVKGLKYLNGVLTFLCSSVGSSSEGNGWGSHDDGESGWGDGNSKTKTTLAVAGLLGPTLAANSSCSSNQFATGLNVDSNGNFGVDCSSLPSASLGSYSYSGSNVSITSGSSASASISGSRFTVVIPNSLLGPTISLDSANDSCSGTDKVSALTLSSAGVFKVVCSSVDNSPITSVAITAVSPSASPSISWNSSQKKLSLSIPAGATGPTGPAGASGATGAAGSDGKDGLTPTISVNSSISTGNSAVSVSKSTPGGIPNYQFSFTLPAIPSGYTAMTVCMNKSTNVLALKSSCSSSETKYSMLIDTTP